MTIRKLLLNKHDTNVFKRTFTTHKTHNEPQELAWQWKVKDDPSIHHCSLACVSKICPKKKFFPRLKPTYVPVDVFSCPKKKPKKMTWYEYFSFLLPDHMTAAKPPLATCRKLLSLRHDICLDPQDWACCDVTCLKQPKEWYGQGVVHAVISNLPEIRIQPAIKPCAPPDHMIPRCVIAKKGTSPSKAVSKCLLDSFYKEPYGDFKGVSSTATSNANKYICRFKCFTEDLPKVDEKGLKLSCRWYSEFKDVVCPRQMYNRYKNVSITSCGDIKPITARKSVTADAGATIEIKKGICGRSTLLRPSGVRNFSTSCQRLVSLKELEMKDLVRVRRSHPQPNTRVIKAENLMKRAGFPNPPINETINKRLPNRMPSKFLPEKKKEVKETVQNSGLANIPLKTLRGRFDGNKKKSRFSDDFKSFSTSAIHFKNTTKGEVGKNKKGKEEEKIEPICSGCAGIRQALSQTKGKKKGGMYAKCRKRASGKCPGPTREIGPNDPPIVNPFQKCKTEALSRCNQPRSVVCKKERVKVPCDKNKKFHTSATQLTMCCPDGCEPPPTKKRRIKTLDIKRESCFNKDKKKEEEEPKGFICKLASVFGVGCGKKKDCM